MNHLVIAPVLLPLIAGILLLLGRQLPQSWQRAFSTSIVLLLIGFAVALLIAVNDDSILVYALGNWAAPYGIVLVADRLSAWMVLITAVLALFPLHYASRGIDVSGRHFHVLYQMQLMGLNGAFLTGDLFNLFVFFEVLLLASYGLILHGGGHPSLSDSAAGKGRVVSALSRLRTKAGLHYVVINLAGSSLFLIAVGTLYGLFGTLNMADLAVKMAAVAPENLGPARAAGLLLFAVFALKAALLPLYLWLPAAYAQTSAPVAALFAIMTKVGAYSILRVASLIFGSQAGEMQDLYQPWLLPLALATLTAGMFGALAARHLREQIAYLVVASVGTLLTAFSLGSTAGIAAGLFYLPHSVFAAAAFFLLADRIAECRKRSGDEIGDVYQPAPAMANAGLLGGLFFVAAILVAGLPPLSGFVGKFLLLQAALAHPQSGWIMLLVLLGGLFALIALARSGSLLFFRVLPTEAVRMPGTPAIKPDWPLLLPVLALLALCLALTVAAGPVHAYASATAEQLLQPYRYVHAVLGDRP
jgi:multicomponent K+:H+ antiporter subunit D